MATDRTRAPEDIRAMLAGHWLFAGLNDPERERLEARLRRRRYGANETIFRKGDPGNGMMAVARGQVKISAYSPEGRAVVLNIINAGEIFGEIALLDGKARTADAVALGGGAELLVLERREFLPLLERRPEIARKLLEVLCARLRRTTEQVEDQLFLDRPLRLAKALRRLADDYGTESEQGTVIGLRLSQGDLGSLTGLSRESINKQLAEWRRQGLIRLDGGRIVLLDRASLDRLVDD